MQTDGDSIRPSGWVLLVVAMALHLQSLSPVDLKLFDYMIYTIRPFYIWLL
jgi:hypothetical protein